MIVKGEIIMKNKSAIWDIMSVEDKHITEGTPDSCDLCPIALAMRDYEPVFDELNYNVHISTKAKDWFGEDDCGAMSHRIVVHPDDVEMVEEFIYDFDNQDYNPHSNDTEDYYEWEQQYMFENFVPFEFKYRVVNWQPKETQGE